MTPCWGAERCGLVVEDRQGPAPAGQFAGDRGVGDHGLLVAGVERGPPVVQTAISPSSAVQRIWCCAGAAQWGRPHERFWDLDLDGLLRAHGTAMCESPTPFDEAGDLLSER